MQRAIEPGAPAVALRDELEAILRGWNAYEVARGATPVIAFDLRPDLTEAVPVESRLEAYHRCPRRSWDRLGPEDLG
jgi:hypothetical protein